MVKDFSASLRTELANLYAQDATAQALFDWTASRKRDATSTSIDRMCSILSVARGEAVRIAKELDRIGCGSFKNGRRGQPSRFEWGFSCISLGKAAAGEDAAIEEVEDPVAEEDDENQTWGWDEPFLSENALKLTIPEAKAAVAALLGIKPEQVEISVKA